MEHMKIIQYDCEFDNIMLFEQYVMVMSDGKMTGGGLILGYDEKEVQVGNGHHLRTKSTFIPSPPPQCFIEF